MIKLSPSRITTFENCPKSYFYKYIEGWAHEVTPAALPFGNAIHAAFEVHLKGMIHGQDSSPVQAFQEVFDAKVKNAQVEFKEDLSMEDMEAAGKAIAQAIPAAWEKTGLSPLATSNGAPIVEYRLETKLADGVSIQAILDVAALNENAETTVMDFKTVKAPAHELFVYGSDQIAAQQLVLAENANALGISPPARLGFMEATKKKVPVLELKKDGTPKKQKGSGPEILQPVTIPIHSPEVMKEFREKWVKDAEQINRGYFPKRPLMAWNSPCKMCDFRNLCMRGDSTGLVQKPYQGNPLELVA